MNLEVSYRYYQRAFVRPLRTAHGLWEAREGFLLRVESDCGVGYGEVAPIPEFGTESVERAGNFLKQWQADPIIMPSGLPCCSFGQTTALHQLEKPVVSGLRDYSVAGLLPAGEAALGAAREKSAAGYTCLKWKIGVEPAGAEQAVFKDLLAGLPEVVLLRLDANGGLAPAELESWLEALGPARERVEYLEQPLAPGEEARMLAASQASGIPIALDESLNQPGAGRWLTPDAWPGPLVIKPLLMGNVTTLLEQLRPLANQLVFSSSFETGVGLFIALGLADLLPEMHHAIGFDTLSAFTDGLSGLAPGPRLTAEARTNMNLEALWNQLPPLT